MIRVKMNDSIEFSKIVLGFWRLMDWDMTPNELADYLEQVLDLGITTMDHADSYGRYQAEGKFGEAIKVNPSLRDKIEIVTKCGLVYKSDQARVKYYNYSKDYIIKQAERSLKQLNVDKIDALLLHRPSPLVNPYEVAEAFNYLYESGKVRSFGVSNHLVEQYKTLQSYLDFKLVTNQVELNPLNMENIENGVLDLAVHDKIHPMIWSPLAGGRIFTGEDEQIVRLRDTLNVIKEEVGANDIGEVIFAWIMMHPSEPVPITGSGMIEYVETAVNAVDIKLTLEHWFMIWTAVKGHKVP
ncbi:aldo/keto reductase [Hutsoniella sourekii]